MDAGPIRPPPPPLPPWRPEGCDQVALVLQGGGALGAYQAGVYQAMHERGLEPDWVSGVSIGAINAAIIAGNLPEERVPRLRQFWETITQTAMVEPGQLPWLDGDLPRKLFTAWSSLSAVWRGQAGLFRPRAVSPWLAQRGARGATSFYDAAPMAATLNALVDWDLLNAGAMRFACGAVQVATGNFAYFDNEKNRIDATHVMASAALPPAFPMVEIEQRQYWDGGIVSNTPLQHLLDHAGNAAMLVLQVDLFSARGTLPRDMFDVMNRQKDIQYSSRTRFVTDVYRTIHKQKQMLAQLLDKLPPESLTEEEQTLKQALTQLPEFTILQLIYQQSAHEGAAKDYDFSATAMRAHWEQGHGDTARTLMRREWMSMPARGDGIVVHDVHRRQ